MQGTGNSFTSIFKTRIATARTKPSQSASASAEWADGLPLELSVTTGEKTEVTIKLGDQIVYGGPDNATFADLENAPEDELVVNIHFGDASAFVCPQFDDGMYLTASVRIDATGAAFTGSVTSTCNDQSDQGAYAWVGQVGPSAAAASTQQLHRLLIRHVREAAGTSASAAPSPAPERGPS